MTRKRRERDVPLADRSDELHEELGRDAPQVNRLSTEEDSDATMIAGVRAAGESDRPAGSHAAPEYPIDEPRSEIDVDREFAGGRRRRRTRRE